MAPELLNSLDAAELRDIASRIREYQEIHKLSDSAMLRRFAALGSTTTYTKILKDKIEELNLETQLINYRSVIALIESSKAEEEDEELYHDLVGTLEVKRAFLETSQTKTVARFILVQGGTGVGKTCCKKALMKQYGMRFLAIEATSAWGDRPNAMLAAILTAYGIKELPTSEAGRMIKVIEMGNLSRRAILIDEGHHMGPLCLNSIKTIINQTPGEVIVFAYQTLWARLERTAYEECKQLTGNRLAERIKLALHDNDVARILEGRLKISKADLKKAVEQCMKDAPQYGNHGFIREVCKKARSQAEGEPVTWEIFLNAITAIKERR